MENKKVRQLFRFSYETAKTPKSRNNAIDRLPKNFFYFFLKVQLKISLNPKFQNFRVTR